MNGARCPVVYDITYICCNLCSGVIRKYVSKIRRKDWSGDSKRSHVKFDYHEVCWCEAIEVQI